MHLHNNAVARRKVLPQIVQVPSGISCSAKITIIIGLVIRIFVTVLGTKRLLVMKEHVGCACWQTLFSLVLNKLLNKLTHLLVNVDMICMISMLHLRPFEGCSQLDTNTLGSSNLSLPFFVKKL